MSSGLLDTAAAAQKLRVSRAFLEKDRVTGTYGIRFIKIGRRVLYDEADLNAWLETRKRKSTSEAEDK